MDSSINDKLKEKACKKAHELAKDKKSDFCTFGKWVAALVLEEFSRSESNKVSLTFDVGGGSGSDPFPCADELGIRLFALEQDAAGGECIKIEIRGKSVTIC